MISFFRNFFQSKLGMPVFIGFLILVALSFAAMDITGTTFGGVSGGDRVAKVGPETITDNELRTSAESALRTVQQDNPTVSMPQLVEQGGLDEVLRQLEDRYAIGSYAEKYNLRAGDNLVNSEILQFAAFRGATGEFDQATYEAALSSQGIDDAILRRDLSDGLLAEQLIGPAVAAPQFSTKATKQYAALLLERRRGEIAFIPSFSFAPEGDPTDAQLETYYSENRARFIRPERRVIRYTVFGADNLNQNVDPTPEEIQAFYEANADRFAATETRSISSFLVPTEEAAQAIVTRIRGGLSLEAAARDAGFTVSTSEERTREQMSSAVSAAVAESVFATQRGQIAEPARSNLGWTVARVDSVTSTPARTLAQATAEITEDLTTQKTAAALAELSSRVEEEVDSGTALLEVADAFGFEVRNTPQILADGRVFGSQAQGLNPALRRIVETAYQMDESEPQLAELIPGQQFIVFDVEEILESAAPPITEIREQVVIGWRLAEGAKEAKNAADRILTKVRGETALSAALSAEDGPFPPIESIDLSRQELEAQAQQASPPPPLVLMFSMALGSTKLYEAPNDIGWYVVDLQDIVTSPIEDGDPLLDQWRQQLAVALRGEYTEQLTKAIRDDVGIERNESAIDAVRRRLLGETP